MHTRRVVLKDASMNKMILMTIVAVLLTLDLVCSKCSSSEFLTEDGHCCRKPQPSYYITKNCTHVSSTSAKPCSTCTGKGMNILINCTQFTDTLCGCADGCNVEPVHLKPSTSQIPLANILVPITAVVLTATLIALFVMAMCHCLHKCRKTGEFLKVPENPV